MRRITSKCVCICEISGYDDDVSITHSLPQKKKQKFVSRVQFMTTKTKT
jgi:hypothetical protein